jgi:hypothetical protein
MGIYRLAVLDGTVGHVSALELDNARSRRITPTN